MTNEKKQQTENKQSEKLTKKQNRKQALKKALAIVLALLLLITAISPIFADEYAPLSANEAQIINTIMRSIHTNYNEEVDRDALIESLYRGLFLSLDDYSTYLSPEEYKTLLTGLNGNFSGIGATVHLKNNQIEIVNVYANSPAQKAGLQKNDIIEKVDDISLEGYQVDQAVSLIRGVEGTKVKLTIKRGNTTKDYVITRSVIHISSVEYSALDTEIGYIKISSFNTDTTKEFLNAISKMPKSVKGLVIDLRQNPGGLLRAALELSEYFLPKGSTILTLKQKGKEIESFKDTTDVSSYKLAVLVDEYSASASEILAGSLQKMGGAIVLGDKTFGKGTVQTFIPLFNGGVIKITTNEYFVGKDTKVNGVGVSPNIDFSKSVLGEAKAKVVLDRAVMELKKLIKQTN